MFKLFRRGKDKRPVVYGVFERIGKICERKQRSLCDYLNQKTKGLNAKQLKVGLIAFCTVYTSCIIMTVMEAQKPDDKMIKIESISVPVDVMSQLKKDSAQKR